MIAILSPIKSVSEECSPTKNLEEGNEPYMINVSSPKHSESGEESKSLAGDKSGHFSDHSPENSEDRLQSLEEQEVVKTGRRHARNNSEISEGSDNSEIPGADALGDDNNSVN